MRSESISKSMSQFFAFVIYFSIITSLLYFFYALFCDEFCYRRLKTVIIPVSAPIFDDDDETKTVVEEDDEESQKGIIQ